MTGRAELERRLDALAGQHTGRDFAEAIRAYSATLDEDARSELKRIVLERAADFDQAVMDRIDARGWFRRQWDKAGLPTAAPAADEFSRRRRSKRS